MMVTECRSTKSNVCYTYDEALNSCLEYYNGDLMQASVAQKKYLLRNKEGTFYEANPDHMHDRLAAEFTRIEKKLNHALDETLVAHEITPRACLARIQ